MNDKKPRCPICKKGVRIEDSFSQGGLQHDVSYCGFCGKNWPKPQFKIVKPEQPSA